MDVLNSRRRVIFILGIPLLLVLMVGIILQCWLLPLPMALFGLGVGTLLGILGCRLLRRVWDPIQLRPTNPKTSPAAMDQRAILAATVGAIIAVRLTTSLLAPDLTGVLGLILVTISVIVLSYTMLQVFIHRPRQ